MNNTEKDKSKGKEKDKEEDYHLISPTHYEDEVERYTVCLDQGCTNRLKCVIFLIRYVFLITLAPVP